MPARDHGEAWRGANQAWDVTGLLLSGIVVCGGLGWLLDRWLHLEDLFRPIGMVLGVSIAIWLIYLKHGKTD
jgi:ATP synthase protein I